MNTASEEVHNGSNNWKQYVSVCFYRRSWQCDPIEPGAWSCSHAAIERAYHDGDQPASTCPSTAKIIFCIIGRIIISIVVVLLLLRGLFYIVVFYKVYKDKLYDLYKTINLLGCLVILQIILGIFTILNGAQIYIASMHQISSIFLVSSCIYFLYINTKIN